MPAGGMAADHQRLSKPRQLPRRRPHLPDDLLDGDIRTKVVARNGNTDAMGVQSASEVAEGRAVQCLPVAAMNKDDDRAFAVAGKKINDLSCAGTVGDGTRSMPRAIGGRILRPTRDQRGVLRNPRPVVVFGFIVDAG